MNTDLLRDLRHHLKAVPPCPDPRLVDAGPLANIGFSAGRYHLAQELLKMLEQVPEDASAEQVVDQVVHQLEKSVVIDLSDAQDVARSA